MKINIDGNAAEFKRAIGMAPFSNQGSRGFTQ